MNARQIRRLGLFLTLVLASAITFAQGYRIEIHLPQAADTSVMLTYYYLGKIYPADTIQTNSKGEGVFQADTLLPEGLYKIYLNENHHFDVLLGSDQQFSIYNEDFNPSKTKIEGAKESEEFIHYMKLLQELGAQRDSLQNQLKNADEEEKEKLTESLRHLKDQLDGYRTKVAHKMPNSFLLTFINAGETPQLDISSLPEEIQKNDSLLLITRFNYQKEHYWDFFDYTDERLLYTPFYKQKLETWFNKVLYPAYDSVKPYVYEFLERVENNKRIFQFATSFFLNSSITSPVMGMDALFIDIARDYYFSGKAFWANEETMDKIRENVLFLQDNLIGNIAPDLEMETYDGEFVHLHDIKAPLTVVLIFEPNCGHCKKFVPKFHDEVYLPYHEKGLEVFAIYSMNKKEEWTNFLVEHKLFDWINVWDPDHITRFKIKYDGRKTPAVYVLDKDKKIIAKKLDVEQLKMLIEYELNKQQ